ncbi:aldo/keto reductase [Streptosporangium sp. NPDC023825]|uniref:aldo/keto reductase n=1 Tax=Streptosporangium sp. NPDC023825 TaxID=3154909 RepID=UPI0034123CCB
MSLDSYRTLGVTGLRVSPLCLGTMTFGSEVLGTDEGTSRELIARYTAAGGNFIDTANGYSQGRSEEVIGAHLAAGRPHPTVREYSF